jgi:hypothetical protein
MSEVVKAEVFDTDALSRSVPGGTTLLNTLPGEGESPAWMLAECQLERGDGIRIERNTTSFS